MPRKKPEGATPSMADGAKATKAKAPAKASQKARGGKKAKASSKTAGKKAQAPSVTLRASEGMDEPSATERPRHPGGRPSSYRPEYAQIARVMCSMGATDAELAEAFGVVTSTIWRWSSSIPEFCSALRVEKGEYDERVKRSLAQRAVGYSYETVKIFMPANAAEPVYAKYMEHVPPDPNAARIWLNNRQPEEWRDRKEITGKDGAPIVPVLNVLYGNGSSQPQSAS